MKLVRDVLSLSQPISFPSWFLSYLVQEVMRAVGQAGAASSAQPSTLTCSPSVSGRVQLDSSPSWSTNHAHQTFGTA